MFNDVRNCVWFVFVSRLAKEHHMRKSNKHRSHSPSYRLVNAVELSLQCGCNIQLRTCIILVILDAFGTPLTRSFPTKNANIYDITLFEGLSFQNTLIRNYYALLF